MARGIRELSQQLLGEVGEIGEKIPSDGDFFTSLLTDGKRVESVFWGEMRDHK